MIQDKKRIFGGFVTLESGVDSRRAKFDRHKPGHPSDIGRPSAAWVDFDYYRYTKISNVSMLSKRMKRVAR